MNDPNQVENAVPFWVDYLVAHGYREVPADHQLQLLADGSRRFERDVELDGFRTRLAAELKRAWALQAA